MNKTFADFGIELRHGHGVEADTTCPQCSSSRKNKKARCLSVNTDKGAWLCHHCGWAGSLDSGEDRRADFRHWAKPTYRKPKPIPVEGLSDKVISWFEKRGIRRDVLARNRIVSVLHWMPQREEKVQCIAFPYFRGGDLVNVKYRDGEKNFCLEAGAERVLFGLDDLSETGIIVEGEVDKLAVECAGFVECVSVPDGAPNPDAKNYASKFDFLDTCSDQIAKVKRWIIAVDNDAPGRELESELSRRLGREKCFRATWPEGCKDAAEVLEKHGFDVLHDCISCAEPYPIEGVFEASGLRGNVIALYQNGLPKGHSTGWPTLDEYFTVRPGEFTVLTGIPNSGKSNFADALAINLSRTHGWPIAMCSPENQPIEDHIARMAEKYTGCPFSAGPTPRMSEAQLQDAMQWLNRHVFLILPQNDMTISAVLEAAKQLVFRKGIKLLVMDPWNEFEHKVPQGKSKTDYICEELTRIRHWARKHDVHVVMVVHPTKLERQKDGSYPVPSLYDCEGSAHWRNKADNGLVIWRDFMVQKDEVSIVVSKIRFRQIGKLGEVKLRYSRVTATYSDLTPSNYYAMSRGE